MLILTRRIGESLVLGDKEVVLTVLGMKGNQVRIGVQAKTHVMIDREEVYLRKQLTTETELAAAAPTLFKKITNSLTKR